MSAELVLPLYGDGKTSDRLAIQHLLLGGKAHDMRTGEEVIAMTLKDIPAGNYWLADTKQ